MSLGENVLSTYLHFRDNGAASTVPVSDAFWSELTAGELQHLNQGRLMSAFTFSAPWPTWERHPAGEELVLLLSGVATMVLDESDQEREVQLSTPGDFVLVPRNIWHTARTQVKTTMLFLTPGEGTEHREVGATSLGSTT
ncbi:cupin domain-containing protein [Isoalcanivorax indicus]|uniref:cupin domain-containing protein n=1 Tax=Isoalcanivorax indicus TaxID=2202653 RepID=UPI000DB905B0|nr:cupin domain-containing protein [Isoalcanivorax indicus]